MTERKQTNEAYGDVQQSDPASVNMTDARSYDSILTRFNNIVTAYGDMSIDSVFSAFSRAGAGLANEPFTQNARVKAINPLPADYTKEDLGEFLRAPQNYEVALQKTSSVLRWTSYPYQKIIKSYTDMLTFKHYIKPLYIKSEKSKTEEFVREWRLVDKLEKSINIYDSGNQIAAQALTSGKVYYTLRTNIDRVHNRVNYAFLQQLPQAWCRIIGFNNISKYTISFDMTYFLQPGTDYTQYGDLFEPYIKDFWNIFEPKDPPKGLGTKYVYATKIQAGGKTYSCDIKLVNRNGAGEPQMFQQNGRWCYYVSLPIDKVWTFEIDNSTAIVASPFAGLFQTFAQQADYEAAQLSLITLPLIKIFTGEIPYNNSETSKPEDNYKLSLGGRRMFEAFWSAMMRMTHTGGTAFFSAPVENIKSHDFSAAANANDVSSSFLQYGFEKTGLTALIPIDSSPKAGTEQTSGYLEGKYAAGIYRTFEKMVNYALSSLNLRYEWSLVIFGSIYTDNDTRSNAMKLLDKGDLSQHFILAALDDMSVLDRISMSSVAKNSGLLELLIPPVTSYTQTGKSISGDNHATGTSAAGAPEKTETEVIEDKQEKRIETKEDVA